MTDLYNNGFYVAGLLLDVERLQRELASEKQLTHNLYEQRGAILADRDKLSDGYHKMRVALQEIVRDKTGSLTSCDRQQIAHKVLTELGHL